MTNYVLVHGSWHGAWCWRRLEPLLQAAGHRTYAVTLTGLGERKHLIGPSVDLTTHVDDVVNAMQMEDLRDISLVGHSYAGLVISGVAGRETGRLRKLVYLDALVPEHGQSFFDLNSPGFRDRVEAQAAALDGVRVPTLSPEIMGVTDPADVAWMNERLTDFPIGAYREKVHMPSRPPSAYIHCTRFGFTETAARCRAMGWPVLPIDASHDVMVTHPHELAALLMSEACR
jgi:pimeloyl-ACP methyl ester carboxylesterase